MSFIKKLWAVKDSDKTKPIEIKGRGEVYAITFLNNEGGIVGGGRKGLVQRWQIANGHEMGKPMNAGGVVYSLRASKDGKWVASATKDGLLTVWDAESHEKAVEINAHTAAVYAVDFSPDSTMIATGSRDNTACIWNILTGQLQLLFGPHVRASDQLASENDDAGVVAVRFSPDGNRVAIVSAWHSIRIHDSYNGDILIDIPIELSPRSDSPLAWSSNVQQVFAATNDGDIACLDASSGSIVFKWHVEDDGAGDIILSTNGKFLVHNVGGRVSFWDTSTRQRVGPVLEHAHTIPSIALSSNDNYLAICGNDNKIVIQNLQRILPQFCFQVTSDEASLSKSSSQVIIFDQSSRHPGSAAVSRNVFLGDGDRTVPCIEGNPKQPIEVQASALLKATAPLHADKDVVSSPDVPCSVGLQSGQGGLRVQQRCCETLYAAGCIKQAADKLQQLMDSFADLLRESQDLSNWVLAFKQRCTEALEKSADEALDAGKYDEAIEQYGIALSLEPQLCCNFYIRRSKAHAATGLWEMASTDADQAIALDPLSPWGYERKQEALHGMHSYDEALENFNKMISLLQTSVDPRSSELRQQRVDSSRAVATVRNVIAEALRDSPHILINTETGRLCDKAARARAMETHPKLKDIILSAGSPLDTAGIKRTIKDFFRYSTLSHTWEGNEPLLRDVHHVSVYELADSPTHTKLQMFCKTARNSGFLWAWSDTCCIDKTDSAILQESLTSMYRWYHQSSLTIIYLRGVAFQLHSASDLLDTLLKCIWNTRAWTLQEYFASSVLRFYTEDWKPYLPNTNVFNHKDSPPIIRQMALASGVDVNALVSLRPGSDNIRQKLRLASTRVATRQEDTAYSLFGIFDVTIPAIYGEGHRALGRLLQEVLTRSGDVTILAWTGKASDYHSCLPAEIAVYSETVYPHVPAPIEDDVMDVMVTELKTSSVDSESLLRLYDRIIHLPSPRLISRRLSLPAIIFPLGSFGASPAPRDPNLPDIRVYTAVSSLLGTVTIRTVDDLSGFQDLILVHPWHQCILDPVHHDQSRTSSSQHLSRLEKAFRLLVRLKRPFGALLLAPLSHREYKRVATDEPVVVQVREDVSSRDLLEGIDVLDVL